MHHRLFSAGLLILITACSSSISTPILVEPTSTLAVIETTTPMHYEVSLFDYDRQSPVSVIENSVQEENGYTIHDIHYPSPKGGNVPAYLLVPDGVGPFAGLILMHGSSGRAKVCCHLPGTWSLLAQPY